MNNRLIRFLHPFSHTLQWGHLVAYRHDIYTCRSIAIVQDDNRKVVHVHPQDLILDPKPTYKALNNNTKKDGAVHD